MTNICPSAARLRRGLQTTIDVPGSGTFQIVERAAMTEGTSPSEVVTCRLADGTLVKAFCKYTGNDERHWAFGQRRGLEYESRVYENLLEQLPVSTPRLLGIHHDAATGRPWLVTSFLPKTRRMTRVEGGMLLAARWLGQFHSAAGRLLADEGDLGLNRYDAEYYCGWARRTIEFGTEAYAGSWLTTICERFEQVAEELLHFPLTAVHGEFYPENVLVSDGIVYPVDWESAAIAPGELDLVALTEGWSEDFRIEWIESYKEARWPAGPAQHFARAFDCARLFVHIRWLGENPEWTPTSGWRFPELQELGRRLGLIS